MKAINSEEYYFNHFYHQKPKAYEDSPLLTKQAKLYSDKIKEAFKFKKTDLILSLGCAQGRFELRFAPEVKKIIGLDISPQAILQAKKQAKQLKIKNAQFQIHDITQKLPFNNQTFNGVLALGIFHHLSQERLNPLLQEINRVLKTNGFFYTIDPHNNGILRIIGRNFCPKIYQSGRSPEERDLDPNQLAAYCHQNGFELKKREFLDFWLAEVAYLQPNLPKIFSHFVYGVDRIWCHIPLLKNFSSQFSLFCQKSR